MAKREAPAPAEQEGAAPPADDWHMDEAPPPPPRNAGGGPVISTAPDVVHIPNTKGWKPTRDYPKAGSHVVSPEGVKYVMVKSEDKAHVIVDAKSGPVYLRRMEEEPAEPDEDAALAARNKVREKKGRKKAAEKPAAKKPDSPGKGRGHGGRAKGERADYANMSDKDLKAWATARQPWFMTRARQIEMQGVTGFRERVAKLMGVGVPGSRSKSKATKAATPAEEPATAAAPKPVSKSTAKKEAAKAEKKARGK